MIFSNPKVSAAGALMVVLGVVIGCARSGVEPRAAVGTDPLKLAALAEGRGLSVRASQGDWPEATEGPDLVKPIRVVIHNDSGEDVQVRFDGFSLLASDGSIYHAIPPMTLGATVRQDSYVVPEFALAGFQPAPYYGDVYPSLMPYVGYFRLNQHHYEAYAHYTKVLDRLATTAMRRQALPEGVLASKGRLDGYLYFPLREATLSPEALLVELRNAQNRAVASLEITISDTQD